MPTDLQIITLLTHLRNDYKELEYFSVFLPFFIKFWYSLLNDLESALPQKEILDLQIITL
jgi:hypothetical protein